MNSEFLTWDALCYPMRIVTVCDFFHQSIGKKGSCPQCIQLKNKSSASPSDGETEPRLVAELEQLKYQLQVRM